MKRTAKQFWAGAAACGAAAFLFGAAESRGEAILQVFNQSHNEIAARLPEIAEAGYTALWVPPPTKANGGMSVGYDLNDPFDIGNTDLRGTWSTRYGVEADLHNLIELCHRFGMRVYFDNVMNHRSYDIPGYNESTPTDVYPGMCPEDFHLRTTSDGFYRKWDNVRDWNDEWQVMFLGLSDLLDIAHETPNQNFGAKEGDWHDKPSFVRHPNNPEFYDWDPDGNVIGFGPENGLTAEDIAAHPDKYSEDVGAYLCRAVRWLVDRTKVDGLRLDAVKHVPSYFFGVQGSMGDGSNDGYTGNVQMQFNRTRGFFDRNHRDTVFNSDSPRNDAMLFGEHLGNPPPQGPYVEAGMRLVDDRLRNELNWRFGANQLEGFDGEYAGTELGPDCGVMHAQSHDNDYVDRKPLHHAMYFMRRGLGLVYSDGNNHAATLTGSGGAFPRWAQTDFLGQWQQKQIPTLLHAHENFARYGQYPKWSQGNYVAFQRGGEGSWATMLFQLNSSWDGWEPAHTSGDFPDNAYLYDYASDMYMPHKDDGSWSDAPYAYGGEISYNVKLPPNSYAIWNWKNPDPSKLYPSPYPDCFVNDDDRVIAPDSRVITILEDGRVVEPVMVTRKDGVDGDPDFNPYGVADTNNADYSYSIAIPRVTKGTDVTLAVKGDGSAGDLLLRLDGGMDFGNRNITTNDWSPEDGKGHYWEQQRWDTEDAVDREDWRDYPPGSEHDFYLGFEKCKPYFTRRIWSEKFAASGVEKCWIGTRGATTYEIAGTATNAYDPENEYAGHSYTAPGWVWHNPTALTETVPADIGDPVTSTKTFALTAQAAGRDGSAAGFGGWEDSSNGNAGLFAGGEAAACGLEGFTGGQAFGLFANPADGGANAIFSRSIQHGSGLREISVDVGMLWDSNIEGSYKGVEFTDASGKPIFGVQIQNSPAVTYYGANDLAGTWSTDYSAGSNQLPRVFNVKLTRTETGYAVAGTTRSGGTVGGVSVSTGADIAGFKAYMNATDDSDERQLYFDNVRYTAEVTETPTGDRQVTQFQPASGGAATVWAKTSQEQGERAYLYYTTDGQHWPEGAAGIPANPYTTAVEGGWATNSDSGSWWRFNLPAGTRTDGTTLRYKVSAFREQGYDGNGWETVWPGNGGDIDNKKAMLTLWTIPGLNFETQQYHKHNDYTSWTTGFKDGYHLVTARLLLNRTDGAPVANTFRQTFYLDTHVPEGYFLYPGEANPDFGESEYGMVFKTDNTVEQVWVHITDGDPTNDGPGNGVGTNGVEWAQATQISPWTKEMAQDTEFTKIWRYPYTRIPSSGTATIRVRFREVSSAPVGEWSKTDPAEDDLEALHVAETSKVATVHAPAEKFYFDWPSEDGTMVEAGWNVRVNFSSSLISGIPTDDVAGKFHVYVNTTSNGSTNRGDEVTSGLNIRPERNNNWWDGDPGTMTFTMPNVYNGIDGWRYALTVAFSNGTSVKSATRMITHRGALLPTCIITTPPETDSDGAKWIITMEDSTEAVTNKALRETPIVVLTDAGATDLALQFVSPEGYGERLDVAASRAAACAAEEAANAAEAARTGKANTNQVAWPEAGALRLANFSSNGTTATWTYAWEVTNAGAYRFEALLRVDNALTNFSAPTNMATRTATVRFRQTVRVSDTNDVDWDDDGITNVRETETNALPNRVDETWTQNEVFTFWSTGKSDADNPDTDGDGLPDGLELGYRWETEGTSAGQDTNGDGWPNFIWDRDPPFYNLCRAFEEGKKGDCGNLGAVPKVTTSNEGGDRAARIQGSVTDPRNPDSDYDGLPDGVEDANRNGWTDGDGEILGQDWDPWLGRKWPDWKMDGETWEETSPSMADSDGDGLSDGYGEDVNLNGRTDMALLNEGETNAVPFTEEQYREFGVDNASTANSSSTLDPKPYTSRAIDYGKLFAAYNVTDPSGHGEKQNAGGWPRLLILETDPLNKDTDHDGLPDGWEARYGLDPLNNGVYDFRTGQFTDDNTHGASGNPDGDTYVDTATGEVRPYDNLSEQVQGTNPRVSDNSSSGGETQGGITVGTGDELGTVNGTAFYKEFTDWTLDDLIALDDYNQGGNSSDIYRWGDGFDSSRDLTAFYFRDGGLEDGKLYFRVDLDDLLPFAEDGYLNIYVAINYGNYGEGIADLPDDVNCKSEMKWNAVVGVYDSQNGCVYVQNDNDGNSFERKNSAFLGAYFNSELDSVVWAVDRRALTDATGKGKWTGNLPNNLMFQVYTTKDFTNDDGGSGDKGGLNDFADIMGNGENDWICSDYWNDYNNIANNGKYTKCASRNTSWDDDPEKQWKAFNHCGQHAKLAIVAHGNQAVEAGSTMQALVDNGAGAGYQRPVKIHNIYTNCPMNLHITPTLAMAMEWAEVGTEKSWFSGPAFNDAIREGVAKGAFALMGSTYSDHVIKYYPDDFNAENAKLSADVLNEIYGGGEKVVSSNVFWLSERVADWTIMQKLAGMGYKATLVDQTPHLLEWFGRPMSLGNDAYKINRYWVFESNPEVGGKEMKAFVLSSSADQFRFANTDGGLSADLRHLFLRRARTGDAAISSMFYRWEDFTSNANADGYDKNLRWIANHPWIQPVSLDAALSDDRLLVYTNLTAEKGMAMQDWVNHACNGNYDNWYYGSDRHRGLASKVFEVRQGTELKSGTAYGDAANGIVAAAWRTVAGITNAAVKRLAEGTIFASAFETAFHDESNDNLSRWSYGPYMWPAKETGMDLMSMSWRAQSRTRLAAVYGAVDEWAGKTTGLRAQARDVDLDGEDEYILQNDKVMAVFEKEGGLMVGAWLKNGTNVWQMVGNFQAQPETGYETQSTGPDARRGAAMKDILVGDDPMTAADFGVTLGEGSLTFKSGALTKTVSLGAAASAFAVDYSAPGKGMCVRNGLSPDLATLMTTGQRNVTEEVDGTSVAVTTTKDGRALTAKVTVTAGQLNAAANDQEEGVEYNTVKMRNMAQTRQVEVTGTGALAYTLEFGEGTTTLEPPAITVTPTTRGEGHSFPVGKTSSFRVTAQSSTGGPVPVEAVRMPVAGVNEGKFDGSTFTWKVPAMSAGGRTNDIGTNAVFRATDAGGTSTETVAIVIPWDSDDNKVGDDWELRQFGMVGNTNEEYRAGGDYDEDGFSNLAEWVAGTDPKSDGSYIGWDQQHVGPDGLELTFRSMPGATYQIEAVDTAGLVQNTWSNVALGVASQGETTTWVDSNYSTYSNRMYRIKIPFFSR